MKLSKIYYDNYFERIMFRIKKRLNSNFFGYKMLLPATFLLLAIRIYPLLTGYYLSLTNRDNLKPSYQFVGLENLVRVIVNDSQVHEVIVYTFIFAIFTVVFSYILGLLLALLLNREIKFKGLFRAMFLLPWVLTPAVVSTNWLLLLNDQFGFVNVLLKNIGIIDKPILFFSDILLAKITVIFISIWRAFPFMMIVLLAGLQSIPKVLYEAAYVDGANFFQSLRYITLPMIKGVSTICTILMFIWTFNNFELIYLLTEGGPAKSTFVLSILAYFTAFFKHKIGYASAIAVVMSIVLITISIFYLRLQKEE